jgi:cytochrome c biogenesis protein
MRFVKKLASLRLTLAGMILLVALALIGTRSPVVDIGITTLPIAVLSLNLLAAIATNRSFRTQTGLLVFHVGLLLVFVLAGLSVLTRFDGHVEVVQGGSFDVRDVEVTEQGWLYDGNLADVQFVQGDIEVDYLPGLIRQSTRSTIDFVNANGVPQRMTIGDSRGAEFAGYRLLATFNKGLALILRWDGNDGDVSYGAVHFPSYPQYDWKQVTQWLTPAGQQIEMKIEFAEPLVRMNEQWVLRRPQVPFAVHTSGTGMPEVVTHLGDSIEVTGGSLHIDDLRMWMAYRVDYFPYLPWMFVAAMLAIGGLVAHFGSRYLPMRSFEPANSSGVANACVASN